MSNKLGIFKKITGNMFGNSKQFQPSIVLIHPQVSLQEEITQSTAQIQIMEQLEIIRIVESYMQGFIIPGLKLNPSWLDGYVIKSEIYISLSEESVFRCNVEAFFQDRTTARRELVYIFNLIRFSDDAWRVFQVQEMEVS
jgi:hypothetical protein